MLKKRDSIELIKLSTQLDAIDLIGPLFYVCIVLIPWENGAEYTLDGFAGNQVRDIQKNVSPNSEWMYPVARKRHFFGEKTATQHN